MATRKKDTQVNFFKDEKTIESGSLSPVLSTANTPGSLRNEPSPCRVVTYKERNDRLNNALKSSLLPMHTYQFASQNKELLNTLLKDDLVAFHKQTATLIMPKDYEKLKELFTLSALLGSKKIISRMKQDPIKVDAEILNMALWSGEFEGKELDYFIAQQKPSYNSLRYAMLSANVIVLAQVFASNPQLKVQTELFTALKQLLINEQTEAQMKELLIQHASPGISMKGADDLSSYTLAP